MEIKSEMKVTPQQIWRIADAINGCLLTTDLLEEAELVLRDHVIELKMRPPDPSVGRIKGATKPQLELWDQFFVRRNKQIICASGANQSSKSDGVGVCLAKFIRDEAKNGDVFWIIAQTYTTLKDVPLKIIYELLPQSMFPAGREKYDPSVHEIAPMVLTLPDKRGKVEVWFKSEDQGLLKFESARLRGIWWTECASQALYEALLPRLLAKGGFMLCDYVSFYGWHRTLLRERSMRPDSPIWYKRFVVMDNAHNLADGAIDRMKATMSTRMWEIRGLGKEAAAQGVVYQNFDPDKDCVDPFPIPDWYPLFLSADWGFNAPHAFLLGTVAENSCNYIVAEHHETQMNVIQTVCAVWEMVNAIRPMRLAIGCATSGEMFEKMRKSDFDSDVIRIGTDVINVETFAFNPYREHIQSEFQRVLAKPCSIDNQVFQRHGGQQTLAQEFAMAGLPIMAANKRAIDSTVETVRRLFDASKMKFFNTCYNLRESVLSWSYRANSDLTPTDKDKYDSAYSHCNDALRYWVQMNPTHDAAIGLEVA